MAPSLDTRGLNAAVRAVAGDRVKFCLPYVGEPAPEIRWVREGEGADGAEQEVQSDRAKAVTLSNTADETKLVRNYGLYGPLIVINTAIFATYYTSTKPR